MLHMEKWLLNIMDSLLNEFICLHNTFMIAISIDNWCDAIDDDISMDCRHNITNNVHYIILKKLGKEKL